MAGTIHHAWILKYLQRYPDEHRDNSTFDQARKRVQIIKFATDGSQQLRKGEVWAHISDKRNWMHARLSPKSVRAHTEKYAGERITELKGACFWVEHYRPIITDIPEFTTSWRSLDRHLALEVDVELLGSRGNPPTFGDPMFILDDPKVNAWMEVLRTRGFAQEGEVEPPAPAAADQDNATSHQQSPRSPSALRDSETSHTVVESDAFPARSRSPAEPPVRSPELDPLKARNMEFWGVPNFKFTADMGQIPDDQMQLLNTVKGFGKGPGSSPPTRGRTEIADGDGPQRASQEPEIPWSQTDKGDNDELEEAEGEAGIPWSDEERSGSEGDGNASEPASHRAESEEDELAEEDELNSDDDGVPASSNVTARQNSEGIARSPHPSPPRTFGDLPTPAQRPRARRPSPAVPSPIAEPNPSPDHDVIMSDHELSQVEDPGGNIQSSGSPAAKPGSQTHDHQAQQGSSLSLPGASLLLQLNEQVQRAAAQPERSAPHVDVSASVAVPQLAQPLSSLVVTSQSAGSSNPDATGNGASGSFAGPATQDAGSSHLDEPGSMLPGEHDRAGWRDASFLRRRAAKDPASQEPTTSAAPDPSRMSKDVEQAPEQNDEHFRDEHDHQGYLAARLGLPGDWDRETEMLAKAKAKPPIRSEWRSDPAARQHFESRIQQASAALAGGKRKSATEEEVAGRPQKKRKVSTGPEQVSAPQQRASVASGQGDVLVDDGATRRNVERSVDKGKQRAQHPQPIPSEPQVEPPPHRTDSLPTSQAPVPRPATVRTTYQPSGTSFRPPPVPGPAQSIRPEQARGSSTITMQHNRRSGEPESHGRTGPNPKTSMFLGLSNRTKAQASPFASSDDEDDSAGPKQGTAQTSRNANARFRFAKGQDTTPLKPSRLQHPSRVQLAREVAATALKNKTLSSPVQGKPEVLQGLPAAASTPNGQALDDSARDTPQTLPPPRTSPPDRMEGPSRSGPSAAAQIPENLNVNLPHAHDLVEHADAPTAGPSIVRAPLMDDRDYVDAKPPDIIAQPDAAHSGPLLGGFRPNLDLPEEDAAVALTLADLVDILRDIDAHRAHGY